MLDKWITFAKRMGIPGKPAPRLWRFSDGDKPIKSVNARHS
ncbi:hypothetical protein [Polaromonas sp.]|nr:hypothetical protein [Polaromonas sp.]